MKGVSRGFILVAICYAISSTCYYFGESYALSASNGGLALAFLYIVYRLREQQ